MTKKVIANLSKDYRTLPLSRNEKIMEAIRRIVHVKEIQKGKEEKEGRFVHFEVILVIELDKEGHFSSAVSSVISRLSAILSGSQYNLSSYRKECQ